MIADPQFTGQPKLFWAHVRTISQQVGYSVKKKKLVHAPSLEQMTQALISLGLNPRHIVDDSHIPTDLGQLLLAYFKHRANVLNSFVEPRLMYAAKAKRTFAEWNAKLSPSRRAPMNKQKGRKRRKAYFTAIVNMLIEANSNGLSCNYDPQQLTTVTRDGAPLRTLARRVDGAFPHVVNPIAVWEIKEYYYTTTFGSRIADGVYESLLDGLELEELRIETGIDVKHYLMVDAYRTWWSSGGRAYLCRIVDMLHMGYVDEVLFGFEVVERLPSIVSQWVITERSRNPNAA